MITFFVRPLLSLCSLCVAGVVAGALWGPGLPAAAQTIPPIELNGYAWSSTIGWISLNCKTGGNNRTNICSTSNYAVTINADRSVTGYAWSSNIGWIRFGGLSGFPPQGGDSQVYRNNMDVTGTYPNLTVRGFARACAGTASSNNACGNMANNANAGGWDGWIVASGTTHRVNLNATSGMGTNDYAWGADVVGWIDWSTHVDFVPVDPGDLVLEGEGCTVLPAERTCDGAVTWSLPPDYGEPAVYNLRTSTDFSTNRTGTDRPITLTLGTTNLTLRTGDIAVGARLPLVATCTTGTSPQGGACVSAPPTISLTPTRSVVRANTSTSILVTVTGLIPGDGACQLYGPGAGNTYTDSTTFTTPNLTSTSRYRLECTGSFGTAETSTTIDVIPTSAES